MLIDIDTTWQGAMATCICKGTPCIQICNGSLKTSVSDKLQMAKKNTMRGMNVVLTALILLLYVLSAEPCVQVNAR